MSLINDALKNAAKSSPAATPNDGSGAKPADPAATAARPMRPAEAAPSRGLPPYFFPVLLCIFCGAIWLLVRGWNGASSTAGGSASTLNVQAREAGSQAAAAAPGSAAASTAQDTPTDAVAEALFPLPGENAPIPQNREFTLNDASANASAPAGGASAPRDAGPRLQAIFYRTSGPSAVVDAETVFVGDSVGGARVVAIDRTSVTLERDGQRQVLSLKR